MASVAEKLNSLSKASVYIESTSPEKRRKIDALLSLQLDETVHEEDVSLKEIMR